MNWREITFYVVLFGALIATSLSMFLAVLRGLV